MARKRSRSPSGGTVAGGGAGAGPGRPATPAFDPADAARAGSVLPAVLAVLAVVAVVAASASAAPADARALVTWSGVVVILVVLIGAIQAWQRAWVVARLSTVVDEQRAALTASMAEHEVQIVRLVQDLLPGTIHLLRKGASVEDVLSGVQLDPGLSPSSESAHVAVLRSVLDAVKAEEELRQYAQRAFVNIARRVQTIVYQQSEDLREMEQRHGGDQAVFGDLMHLDHGTALIGRLADSLAVLGGERPGRQRRQPVPLFSVLRGAMSRILDYRRVEIHAVVETAVLGPVVEPLIHALAELLDNATRYSPPDTWVHLTAMDVQGGIAVEVEDAGVGLTDQAAARAERMLAQVSIGLDLADMGQAPRLGMSVVGRLAQAYGFSVSLRVSAYGGVRAVLYLPHALLTELAETDDLGGLIGPDGPGDPAESAPRVTRDAVNQAERSYGRQGSDSTAEAGGDGDADADALPQRRRKVTTEPSVAAVQAALRDFGSDIGAANATWPHGDGDAGRNLATSAPAGAATNFATNADVNTWPHNGPTGETTSWATADAAALTDRTGRTGTWPADRTRTQGTVQPSVHAEVRSAARARPRAVHGPNQDCG